MTGVQTCALPIYIFNYNFWEVWLSPPKNGYWFTLTLFNFFILYSISSFIGQKIKLSTSIRTIIFICFGILLYIISTPTFHSMFLTFDAKYLSLFDIYHLGYYIFFIAGVVCKRYFYQLPLFRTALN